MSLELASLVFLDGAPGAVGPMRIKVDERRSAVLGFRTSEVAKQLARRWGFEATVLNAAQLDPDLIGAGDLLVFDTVEEVDVAYQTAGTYDFARHLREWPTS